MRDCIIIDEGEEISGGSSCTQVARVRDTRSIILKDLDSVDRLGNRASQGGVVIDDDEDLEGCRHLEPDCLEAALKTLEPMLIERADDDRGRSKSRFCLLRSS